MLCSSSSPSIWGEALSWKNNPQGSGASQEILVNKKVGNDVNLLIIYYLFLCLEITSVTHGFKLLLYLNRYLYFKLKVVTKNLIIDSIKVHYPLFIQEWYLAQKSIIYEK